MVTTRSACNLPLRGAIRNASILLAMVANPIRQRKNVCHAQVSNLSVHHHAQTLGLGVAHCRQDGGVTDGQRPTHTPNAYKVRAPQYGLPSPGL
jgi:hypothetical protein